MTSQTVEYENLISSSFTASNPASALKAPPLARWERKALAASNSTPGPKTPGKRAGTPGKGGEDRFIPNRAAMEGGTKLSYGRDASTPKKSAEDNAAVSNSDPAAAPQDSDDANTGTTKEYADALSQALSVGTQSRVLSFKDKAPAPKGDTAANLKVLYSQSACDGSRSLKTKVTTRHIPSAPSRILDAPDLLDDYYLNLLAWNDQNVLAVSLSQTVYVPS
ncbi:hypothetical protein TeGR_g2528 [Tetraparma gracilis]|uniref:Uncharacterized protein n=1 Tax=Tetraparma gracilis TaxID=2962635 RepID=A0ABQ6MWU2_9STRA|nr:hypothetical protein TeGR_g2528 [Tetraparma gracilis]